MFLKIFFSLSQLFMKMSCIFFVNFFSGFFVYVSRLRDQVQRFPPMTEHLFCQICSGQDINRPSVMINNNIRGRYDKIKTADSGKSYNSDIQYVCQKCRIYISMPMEVFCFGKVLLASVMYLFFSSQY